MKTKISPMWLTYFMVRWDEINQEESDQKCNECGKPMMKTELVIDEKGRKYEGFVCHSDKQVTWVRVG
ncbi:MAG TPA: hypothetical protein VED22_01920 [Nitrososphaerales archaeon]|nr:hypothetical protein [Nitrososphaerales archaeon]